jgi:hypothetical protein
VQLRKLGLHKDIILGESILPSSWGAPANLEGTGINCEYHLLFLPIVLSPLWNCGLFPWALSWQRNLFQRRKEEEEKRRRRRRRERVGEGDRSVTCGLHWPNHIPVPQKQLTFQIMEPGRRAYKTQFWNQTEANGM